MFLTFHQNVEALRYIRQHHDRCNIVQISYVSSSKLCVVNITVTFIPFFFFHFHCLYLNLLTSNKLLSVQLSQIVFWRIKLSKRARTNYPNFCMPYLILHFSCILRLDFRFALIYIPASWLFSHHNLTSQSME